nr:MAG TPA: hypothetical protein [Caudoviricetes sp.]DAJ27365.1 MAG TPA: hypothetical protein [Caudoviricetes sp.]
MDLVGVPPNREQTTRETIDLLARFTAHDELQHSSISSLYFLF